MKLLIQKINDIEIYKDNKIIFQLSSQPSLLIYVGIEKIDQKRDLNFIVNKLLNLNLIDDNGKFNKSIKEINPYLIFVSNITLVADFSKKRINFNNSLNYLTAKNIFDTFIALIKKENFSVFKTDFGSWIKIQCSNIGPINFFLTL